MKSIKTFTNACLFGAAILAAGQARQHVEMPGHPLVDCVGKDQIDPGIRHPTRGIGLRKRQRRQSLTRSSEHCRGVVETGDGGIRIARHQQFRGIAGAAAHVDDAAGRSQPHLRQQITRRSGPFIHELRV